MSTIDDLPAFGNLDKREIQPIHQKRILAFVNKFIVSTVSFLNNFAVECETKFLNYETKLQNVETSLKIIESKLSSIDIPEEKQTFVQITHTTESVIDINIGMENTQLDETVAIPQANELEEKHETSPSGTRAADHELYQKYFRMLQFGVPVAAVKLKMNAEGVDPSILDEPNQIITINTVNINEQE